jgi:hypothetical protein
MYFITMAVFLGVALLSRNSAFLFFIGIIGAITFLGLGLAAMAV